ncbi:MAG TPA: hypothetical protein VGI70_02295 [Polyangiales bacterium]
MNHDDMPMWDDPAESSALRQLLRAGRNAASDYDVDRGLARHLAALQAGSAAPKWAAGAAARGASTPLLTWLVVPLVAASAFVGVWFVSRENRTPQPMVVPDQVVDPAIARALPHAEPAPDLLARQNGPQPMAAGQPLAIADEAKPSANDDRSQRAGPRANIHPLSQRHSRATRALDVAAPTDESSIATSSAGQSASEGASGIREQAALPPSVQHSTTDQEPPPRAAAVEAPRAQPTDAKPEATKHATSNGERGPNDDARLEREMQMLAVAQRVLPNDPARALRLAREGDREFAGSMFSAERKQVGLLALVQLGRLEEARRLGAPFLVAYPNAPWSERLRRALATGRIPAP